MRRNSIWCDVGGNSADLRGPGGGGASVLSPGALSRGFFFFHLHGYSGSSVVLEHVL